MSLFKRRSSLKQWRDSVNITSEDVAEAIGGFDESKKGQKAKLELEARLPFYNGINPWVPVLPFTNWEKFKMFFFCVTLIFPLKCLYIVLVTLLCYLVSLPLTLGRERDENGQLLACPRWRKPFEWIFRLLLRSAIFVLGVYYVPVTYEGKGYGTCCNGLNGRPLTIVANHTSVFDGFLTHCLTTGAAAAKVEMREIPMVGRMMEAMGCIFINRRSAEERQKSKQRIRDYQSVVEFIGDTTASDNCWLTAASAMPPLFVFPQGTCSNTHTMTQFKMGSFAPGIGVQPMLIHYDNRFADMLLAGEPWAILHLGCQFANFISVTFTEPYFPSEEESKDVRLYASNVRKFMAERLGRVLTKHSIEDIILRQLADKFGTDRRQFDTFLANDMYEKFNMKAAAVLKLGKTFIAMADENGVVDMDLFKRLCGVLKKGSGEESAKKTASSDGKLSVISATQNGADASGNFTEAEYVVERAFELLLKVSGDLDFDEAGVERQLAEASKIAPKRANSPQPVHISASKQLTNVLTFEHMLVFAGVSYNKLYATDALTFYFALCDRNADGLIEAKDMRTLAKCIEGKGDSDSLSWNEFLIECKQLCADESECESLMTEWIFAAIGTGHRLVSFDAFENRLRIEGKFHLVQCFLQWILHVFTGVTLDAVNDFRNSPLKAAGESADRRKAGEAANEEEMAHRKAETELVDSVSVEIRT